MTKQTGSLADTRRFAHRALLGRVFPALRRISVEVGSGQATFRVFVDGALHERDAATISEIAAELASSLGAAVITSVETLRVDAPTRIVDTGSTVFQRREVGQYSDER